MAMAAVLNGRVLAKSESGTVSITGSIDCYSAMERWKLIDAHDGTFQYIGKKPFHRQIIFSIDDLPKAVNGVITL